MDPVEIVVHRSCACLPLRRGASGPRLYSGNGRVRQFQLTPEAEPILDSVAASFGGDASLALSELPIAHESIESFFDEMSLDEMEGSCSEDLIRQRDLSALEFRDGSSVSWEKVNLNNGL